MSLGGATPPARHLGAPGFLDILRRRVVPAGRRATPAPRALVVATALVAAIVVLPILYVVSSVLSPRTEVMAHLSATILPTVLYNSLAIVLVVGVLATSIGVAGAWLVTQCRFPGSRAFAVLLVLPLAMPAYIIGYAYADFLAFAGPLQSGLRETFGWRRGDYWFPTLHDPWSVGVLFSLVLYPYVYLIARAAFLEQAGTGFDAARALGHGPWSAFFRVALPLARPAIAAGLALALMEALADFATVQYFGVNTFTTAIYRTWFGFGDRIAASQLATMLLGFVLLLVVLERWARGRRRFGGVGRQKRPAPAFPLRGWKAGLAVAACAAPVTFGFLLPVAILVRLHLRGGDALLGDVFLRHAGNAVLVASLAALIVVAVALLLASALRHAPQSGLAGLVRVATIGYAVPGTVIAIGVIAPLGAFDNAIDGFFRTTFGISTGLILSGTLAALILAYLVRFLAVAYGAVDSGFAKISRNVDDAARCLGRGTATLAARIHLPLLRGPIATAALVVFVDVLKEVPATLIVRPFGFDTLAVRVYNLAADERLAQAATGSLAIVLVGLLPVIVLTRAARR